MALALKRMDVAIGKPRYEIRSILVVPRTSDAMDLRFRVES
jgi:hypothetical protein